LVSEEYV
jgi:hypothetical protein